MSNIKESKTTFDLTLASAKCDLRRIMDVGFRERYPQLKAKHFEVLAFIFYRTITWGRIEEWASYRLFQDGVKRETADPVFGKYWVPPVNQTKPTLIDAVQELLECGAIKRREFRSDEGDKGEMRFIYSIDFGGGIILQGKGHSLGEHRASVCLYLCSKEAFMLPVPKKQRESQIIDYSRQRKLTPEEEFGEEPLQPVANPLSLRRLDPSKEFGESGKDSLPQIEKSFTTSSKEDSPHINTIEDTQKEDTQKEEHKETADAGSVDRLKQVVQGVRMRTSYARTETKASILQRSESKTGELETLWKLAYSETFKSPPIPWGGKEQGIIRVLQKKWLDMGLENFGEFLDATVRYWDSIGKIWFNYGGEKKSVDSKGYPERPVLGYISACFDTYYRAFQKKQVAQEEPAMTPRQLLIARLEARNIPQARIDFLVAERFDKKEAVQQERSTKQAFKAARQEEARQAKAAPVQPVAKPLETRRAPLVTTEEFKSEVLPAWK